MSSFSINDAEVIKVVTYTFLAFVLMTLVLIIFFYFSRKKILKYELGKKDLEIEHQKNMLHAVVFTQEEDRKRIAQDLHDDISSKLNVVSLNGHLLKTPNLSNEEQSEIISNIILYTKNALENSRRIAHDLLPPVLEKFGLNSGIEELVAEYNSTKAISVKYECKVSFVSLSFNHQLHVFRILQELLNNTVKHAEATNVYIEFITLESKIVCTYSDDGKGFDESKCELKKGIGMRNIESRIDFLNATLECNSIIGKGTIFLFKF